MFWCLKISTEQKSLKEKGKEGGLLGASAEAKKQEKEGLQEADITGDDAGKVGGGNGTSCYFCTSWGEADWLHGVYSKQFSQYHFSIPLSVSLLTPPQQALHTTCSKICQAFRIFFINTEIILLIQH